jgi:hypothetical protein
VKRLTYAGLRALSALQHFGSERFTHAGWLVLGAAGTAAALGIDTSRTMSYQAFTFGAALLLIALIVALFFRTHASVERQLRAMPRQASDSSTGSWCTTTASDPSKH